MAISISQHLIHIESQRGNNISVISLTHSLFQRLERACCHGQVSRGEANIRVASATSSAEHEAWGKCMRSVLVAADYNRGEMHAWLILGNLVQAYSSLGSMSFCSLSSCGLPKSLYLWSLIALTMGGVRNGAIRNGWLFPLVDVPRSDPLHYRAFCSGSWTRTGIR